VNPLLIIAALKEVTLGVIEIKKSLGLSTLSLEQQIAGLDIMIRHVDENDAAWRLVPSNIPTIHSAIANIPTVTKEFVKTSTPLKGR